mmetsp:Transcript_115194/g.215741  ORF Transcript_115194/g.215741 Transcript_115194/m.215741 type:complete len:271 (-) Transcript_115194:210-1022(-)
MLLQMCRLVEALATRGIQGKCTSLSPRACPEPFLHTGVLAKQAQEAQSFVPLPVLLCLGINFTFVLLLRWWLRLRLCISIIFHLRCRRCSCAPCTRHERIVVLLCEVLREENIITELQNWENFVRVYGGPFHLEGHNATSNTLQLCFMLPGLHQLEHHLWRLPALQMAPAWLTPGALFGKDLGSHSSEMVQAQLPYSIPCRHNGPGASLSAGQRETRRHAIATHFFKKLSCNSGSFQGCHCESGVCFIQARHCSHQTDLARCSPQLCQDP